MMIQLGILLAWLLSTSIGHAQLVPGPTIELRDEGSTQGRARALDCVGTGVACTVSAGIGTVTISSSGGAPTGYAYWGSGADATLSAEINLALLSTGLVLNTAGTPSAYPGATCTNQVIRLLSASGAATCQTITSAYVDTSIWTGTVASGLLKASSQGILAQASAGTDYVVPAGNVATATALAANGGNCIGNNFALGVDASGAAECAQPAFSNLSGTLALSQTSMATSRLLGRVTAGAGVVEELTGTQATTLLDAFTSGLKGLAPASGGGTTNFLRADGTWTAPPGGGGAPTDATYWVGAAHASLSAELNLGALGTGLVINTTGTPSIYAGTSCTNQFPRSLNASGAATCADVAPADFASQTANFVLAAPNGSAGDPTFRALVDADVPDTITLTNLTQIGTRQISDTTGTLAIGRGGTGQTTITTNQVYVGTALDTLAAKTLPSCSNGTTSKLLFNSSTQEFSCGTDQSGGAGASWTEYELDFGSVAKPMTVATVTDAAVSGTSKIIVMQSGAAATGRQADENEMDAIQCSASPQTGTFKLQCHVHRSVTHGKFKVLYNVS